MSVYPSQSLRSEKLGLRHGKKKNTKLFICIIHANTFSEFFLQQSVSVPPIVLGNFKPQALFVTKQSINWSNTNSKAA